VLDKDDSVRYGRFLDTTYRRGNGYGFYDSSRSNRYHGHHHYHPYMRSGRGYLADEFKTTKPHIFDGHLEKPKYGRWTYGRCGMHY